MERVPRLRRHLGETAVGRHVLPSEIVRFLEPILGDPQGAREIRQLLGERGDDSTLFRQDDREVLREVAVLIAGRWIDLAPEERGAAGGGGGGGAASDVVGEYAQAAATAAAAAAALAGVAAGAALGQVTLRSAPPGARTRLDTTWIEVILLYEDGSGVAGEPYCVTCPDGSTRTGRLDSRGFARITGIPATSLDGFIAREDGGIDWLAEANARVPKGEDCGFAEFMSTVDALVMGRKTFELVRTFATWPYGDTPMVVLSSRMGALPDGVPGTVYLTNETPRTLLARLSGLGMRHLYIDGGVTIQRFLAAQLIDEITITTIPVVIGAGRPLFGPLAADVQLEHLSTRAFEFGFVQNKYRVVRPPRDNQGGAS